MHRDLRVGLSKVLQEPAWPAQEAFHLAAVSLLLCQDWAKEEPFPSILLVKKNPKLKDHGGQWSLPGGKKGEGETPLQTALREAQEEVGLDPSSCQLLGALPKVLTVTGYLVVPLLFSCQQSHFVLDQYEVVDQLHFRRKVWEERQVMLPLKKLLKEQDLPRDREAFQVPAVDLGEQGYLWGATYKILKNLFEVC